MKISKQYLKQIIMEEIQNLVEETTENVPWEIADLNGDPVFKMGNEKYRKALRISVGDNNIITIEGGGEGETKQGVGFFRLSLPKLKNINDVLGPMVKPTRNDVTAFVNAVKAYKQQQSQPQQSQQQQSQPQQPKQSLASKIGGFFGKR